MLKESSGTRTAINSTLDDKSVDELRSLMLGEEYEQAIKNLLAKSEVERVADVISEAFRQRNESDQSLAKVISPVIESAIEESIKNNPRRITDVIFPIMGPAVRKAVANALADMVKSLNYLLQQSLSVKALSWRFKAWRLGIPYGQFVLFQNLQYRVEQVFLIHKETGLLIQSASVKDVVHQDPALVSSMLSAITDFVNDSFQQSQGINEIQFGEVSLLIESGPDAVLAFAVRGNANKTVKQCLVQTLEVIHQKYKQQLHDYQGDNVELQQSYSLLETALIEQTRPTSQSKPWLAIGIISLATIVLIWWLIVSFQHAAKIQESVDIIKRQPGYQYLSHDEDAQNVTFDILRSINAVSIAKLQAQLPQLEKNIQFNQKLTLLDEIQIFTLILQQRYQGEKPLSFSVQNNVLIVNGTLSQEKLTLLHQDSSIKSLFININTKNLIIEQSLTVLQKNDLQMITTINRIKNQQLYFESASDSLEKESNTFMNQIIQDLKLILNLQQQSSISVLQISVVGFADHKGGENANRKLSLQRAESISKIITDNGIDSSIIVHWGSGSQDLADVPSRIQRRAEIDVLFRDSRSAMHD